MRIEQYCRPQKRTRHECFTVALAVVDGDITPREAAFVFDLPQPCIECWTNGFRRNDRRSLACVSTGGCLP